jgi:hypothetical protein
MTTTKDAHIQGESLHLEDSWNKKDEEAPVTIPTTRSPLLVRKVCVLLYHTIH